MPQQRIRKKSNPSRYVDDQSGWRMLLLAVVVGAILGLSFRIYFSPVRIKAALNDIIKKNDAKGLSFEEAELKLSRGSVPQLGIVLRGVKYAPAPECWPDPSVSIAELILPFRLTSFMAGKVALSVVSAEDMIVDIDGMKVRCDEKISREKSAVADRPEKSPESPPSSLPSSTDKLVWWNEEELQKVRSLIRGFDFRRVELQYEKKTKRVFLDEFSARLPRFNGPVELTTLVVVPPEVSYGEKLPPLSLEAEAWADHASVEVNAHMSEGRLTAAFGFKPAPNQALSTDAHFKVSDVPLSEMVPLLNKAGITPPEFKPKSLWFDCSARISGPFQQIFDHSPLFLSKCAVKGDGAHIEVDQATRRPSGVWDPFVISLTRVSLSKVLATVGAQGPAGIATDLGRLSGNVDIRSKEDAGFAGALEGVKLAFRRKNVRAEQVVPHMQAHFNLVNGRFKGAIDKIVVENGEFNGRVEFDLDRNFKNGSFKGEVQTLVFDPKIQTLLVHGLLGSAHGKGSAEVTNGKMSAMSSELTFGKTQGEELRFEQASIKAHLETAGSIAVEINVPALEFSKASPGAVALTPLFFNHQFKNDWISIDNVRFNARIPEGGGIRWSRGEGSLENGQIKMSSEGAMSLERKLFGWIEVDYPAVKNLRFALGGTSDAPVLTDNSPSLKDLRSRARVDDFVLGLKTQ